MTTSGQTMAQVELVGPSEVSPGEQIRIGVEVTLDEPLYAAQFTLVFDEPLLSPGSIEKGTFLSRDARTVVIVNETGTGSARFGETRVGTDTGVNGTGTLATVSFTVGENATGGEVSLGLRNVKLATPGAEIIETTTENTTVAVRRDGDDAGPASSGSGSGGGQTGDAPRGEVEIADRSLLNDTVLVGAPVVVRVDLTNFDPASGRLVLDLSTNGTVMTERRVSVGPSRNRTVYLQHRFGEPGTYPLQVNGVRVGTVTVTEAETPTRTATTAPPETEPTSTPVSTRTTTPTGTETPVESNTVSPTATTGDGPGFSAPAVVVAIGVLVGLGRRA
jgi:hypothetical protein